jgi:hypothetical protein
MTLEHLNALHQKTESTLHELMDILKHTPYLAGNIKPLMAAPDVLAAIQLPAVEESELAERWFRLTLATTMNYHTLVEIGRQLAKGETRAPDESKTKKRKAKQ